MAFDFPPSPTLNQLYVAHGVMYRWNGYAWDALGADLTAYAPLASPVFTGNPTAPTPAVGDNDTSIATTAFVTSTVGAPNCGRLTYVSGTQLKFAPFNGDKIKINGTIYDIPAAGIAGLGNTGVFIDGVGGQNLAANTAYFVYCFNNGGTLTADYSGTGRTTSSVAGNVGVETKAGDSTRTLIGLIAMTGTSFFDGVGGRGVRSWFNPYPSSLALSVNVSTASTTQVGLAGPIYFVAFSEDTIVATTTGHMHNDTGAQWVQFLYLLNGIQYGSTTLIFIVNSGWPGSIGAGIIAPIANDGLQQLLPAGFVSAGTGTWAGAVTGCLIRS